MQRCVNFWFQALLLCVFACVHPNDEYIYFDYCGQFVYYNIARVIRLFFIISFPLFKPSNEMIIVIAVINQICVVTIIMLLVYIRVCSVNTHHHPSKAKHFFQIEVQI